MMAARSSPASPSSSPLSTEAITPGQRGKMASDVTRGRGTGRSRATGPADDRPKAGPKIPLYTRPPMITTNQFRNGSHIDVDGTIFKILEFQHVKPGKGGAFVRTRLRRASDGAVIDRTFRAGEKF